MRRLNAGSITVDAIDDGVVHLPTTYYPGADFARDPSSIGPFGTYDIPIGCFLVRGPDTTVLVDTGLGPCRYSFPPEVAAEAGLQSPPDHIAEGGHLLDALRELGVSPQDVDTVVLTHLHADHIGWIAPEGRPTFDASEVLCAETDWSAPLVDPAPGEAEGRVGLQQVADVGGLRLLSTGRHVIADGIVAEVVGGHTPGHTVVEVCDPATGDVEVLLIGDAVHHPDQLVDPDVSFRLEDDPASALRVREDLLGRVTGHGIALGMSHWRGLSFQRVDPGPPRQWRDC